MGDSSEKTPKVSFFSGVKTEFKKISWPDKESLLKQTVAVAGVSVVVGIIIAIIDLAAQYGINFLTSL